MNVLRGLMNRAATILEQVVKTPNRDPTRIITGACANYSFLRFMLDAGLVEVTGKGHYGRRLRLTDKGRVFLKDYRILQQLFPE